MGSAEASWDVTVMVTGKPVYTGDANADKKVDIADAICILSYLFGLQTDACKAPKCLAQLDTNGSNEVDIADAITVLSYLFANGNMTAPDKTLITPTNPASCKLYTQVTLPCAQPCAAK
jgi:hypothetical protein